MLIRALFWIGAVLILMPREPGLPSRADSTAVARGIVGGRPWSPQLNCSRYTSGCEEALQLFDRARTAAFERLVQVKADIETDDRVPGLGTRTR